MAQVDIELNGRPYKITCEDGQEERLLVLSHYLDAHVSELVDSLGQIGEARLLLLAGLTVCDELFELREKAAGGEGSDSEALKTANTAIEQAARRLNAIAEML
ncbi:MAG: cell division protein ZapA [Pseudomonadota bacterium]